jgi:DNA repair exonuclease SbcCD nuclease subunit
MKLAIMGDLHLGYERFAEDSFTQAEEALRSACGSADLVLLAGDIFDTRVPKQETYERAFRLFNAVMFQGAELAQFSAKAQRSVPRVPFVAIHGTHERRMRDLSNPIQVLEAAGLVVNVHDACAVFSKGGERVAVCGMGGVPEEYARSALQALSVAPLPDAFNVFMFHQTLRELVPPTDFLSVDELPVGYDLYVCGHIHWMQKAAAHGKPLLLPGSTVLTQMKRNEEASKGYFMFDTAAKQAEFVAIDSRPFFYVEAEFSDATLQEVRARCADAISKTLAGKAFNKTPIVRLRLGGTLAKGLAQANVELSDVAKQFEGKAIVEIDRAELESGTLKEAIERLREARERKLSVRETGMALLKEKARGTAAEQLGIEELFAQLGEGSTDAAFEKLLQVQPKQEEPKKRGLLHF